MSDGAQRPDYLGAAFRHPAHLTALAGLGVAAVALGAPFVAIAVVAEAAYLAVLPRMPRFRRQIDAIAADERRKERTRRMQEEAATLPGDLRTRVHGQLARVAELRREVERQRPLSSEFLRGELSRLDDVLGDYVHLHLTAWRAQSHLAKADVRGIQRERDHQRRLADEPGDDHARALARQNADVLDRRLAMAEEMGRFVTRAKGQLQLVENTLALVRDQVLTLAAPEAIAAPLGDLVTSLEAMRQATREVEAIVTGTALAALREAGGAVEGDSTRAVREGGKTV